MSYREVHVVAYSGYQAEESPRTIVLHSKRIKVVRIESMWIEEGAEDRSIKRFFKVKGSDGKAHELYYDEKKMKWFQKRGNPLDRDGPLA